MRRHSGANKTKTRRRKVAREKRPETQTRLPHQSQLEGLIDELRRERDEALEQKAATSEVLQTISRSRGDLEAVFKSILANAVRLCGSSYGALWLREENKFRSAAFHGDLPQAYTGAAQWRVGALIEPPAELPIAQATKTGKPFQYADLRLSHSYQTRYPLAVSAVDVAGILAILAVPMVRNGVSIGVIAVYRKEPGVFSDGQIELVSDFAAQAVIAIENTRLFNEIQEKSRQLAEASQHKSQFLASMSHELRTPLNAILGYTELISDGIYGAPPEKMQAVLKRVESNGQHLFGLINAVLDLSKIEAGQLTLDLAEYSLQIVAQTVYNAVEPLALDKKLGFRADIEADLPPGRGDERRLTQVLLNLVGNAVKFTDAGEVVINAGTKNSDFHLSVRDTGPGISAADQARLFQEFQQAENPKIRKKEGTGLGLAISKRIIEMHGGRIWIESQLGQGSTFFVTIPVQVRKQAQS
jgi:signal transduction histidine kinase